MSRKALCVGINKYKTSPLSSCCDDAKVLSDLLSINSDGSPKDLRFSVPDSVIWMQ